jgi:phosphoglycolate phosphatase
MALSTIPTVVQSVLTGNITSNARAKLHAFGLDRWVDLDVGGFGSDGTIRSNLVGTARRKVLKRYGMTFDRSSTILIGDTPLDVKAAHDGGAKIITVATGVYDTREPEWNKLFDPRCDGVVPVTVKKVPVDGY